MTPQQKERLEELRKELEIWKKQQKLNKFKQLLAHIRQEIVNDAIVQSVLRKIHDVNAADFPDIKELDKLASMPNMPLGNMQLFGGIAINTALTSINGNYYNNSSDFYTSKYCAILALFTEKELVDAHIESSLEEELFTPAKPIR